MYNVVTLILFFVSHKINEYKWDWYSYQNERGKKYFDKDILLLFIYFSLKK